MNILAEQLEAELEWEGDFEVVDLRGLAVRNEMLKLKDHKLLK